MGSTGASGGSGRASIMVAKSSPQNGITYCAAKRDCNCPKRRWLQACALARSSATISFFDSLPTMVLGRLCHFHRARHSILLSCCARN
jgi:hypothetical protein